MRDHTAMLEKKGTENRMVFSPVFNAAAAFLARERLPDKWEQAYLVTQEGQTLTRRELAENAARCGNLLLEKGAQPGDRVLLVLRDGPAFPAMFLGAILAGVVPVALNTLLRAPDYRFLIDDSRAAAVIYSPEFAPEVEPAIAGASYRPRFVMVTEGGLHSLSDVLYTLSSTLAPAPAAPEDACYWLYSSGSTGRPKGVVHKHSSPVFVAQRIGMDGLGVRPDDVAFSTSKMFFAYGLGNSVTVPLWAGASAVVTGVRPTPELVFDIIEEFKPTLFYSVPTLYAMLVKTLEKQTRDLSSLRGCFSSGEALPAGLFLRWREKTGMPILDVLGTTETCYCVIGSTPDHHRPGYSGVVLPDIEARVVDEEGHDRPPGEPGQLLVRTQGAAKHYWNNPEKTAETMLEGGWLRTGDTISRDADGFFKCQGRDDDMLKISGIWCSPLEIEAKLIEHPKVLECAVVARANEDKLLKPEAWVVLKNAGDASPALTEELLALCKEHLAPYKYPRWFNYVEELPKTATGKIRRVELRERHPKPASAANPSGAASRRSPGRRGKAASGG